MCTIYYIFILIFEISICVFLLLALTAKPTVGIGLKFCLVHGLFTAFDGHQAVIWTYLGSKLLFSCHFVKNIDEILLRDSHLKKEMKQEGFLGNTLISNAESLFKKRLLMLCICKW